MKLVNIDNERELDGQRPTWRNGVRARCAGAHRARDTERPCRRTRLRQPLAVGPHAQRPGRGHHPWLRRRGAARERKSHRARHAAPVGGEPATRPSGP